MVHKGRMPIIEVDGYPDAASERPIAQGHLPPGNAIVTLAVDDLEAVKMPPITQLHRRQHAPYSGRRSAVFTGPEGELIELVEIG